MREHGVDPEPYLAEVHDIDLVGSRRRRRSSRAAIGRLPGRKVVFTNGSREHARRVTRRVGLDGAFDALYGFEDAGYVPKPEAAAFAAIFALDGLRAGAGGDVRGRSAQPRGAARARHAHGAGRPAAAHPHVHHQTEDLAGFLGRRRLSGRMERIETDVLVAGGGVAGLTAAAAFAAAGFRVVCVDPVPPVDLGRGRGLGPAQHRLPAAGGGAARSGPGSGSGWRRRRRRSG